METPDFKEFEGLGLMITELFEKTAAEKAGESLALDAYIAGFEQGMGVEEAMDNHCKVAAQAVGRNIMGDFVYRMFLNK